MRFQCTECFKVSKDLATWADKLFQSNVMYCPHCNNQEFTITEGGLIETIGREQYE